MAGSEEGLGVNHPATFDQPKRIETELREVSPGQFGYVAVRGQVVVPQRRAQLSEIAHGEGDESVMSFSMPSVPPRNQDTTRDT